MAISIQVSADAMGKDVVEAGFDQSALEARFVMPVGLKRPCLQCGALYVPRDAVGDYCPGCSKDPASTGRDASLGIEWWR